MLGQAQYSMPIDVVTIPHLFLQLREKRPGVPGLNYCRARVLYAYRDCLYRKYP